MLLNYTIESLVTDRLIPSFCHISATIFLASSDLKFEHMKYCGFVSVFSLAMFEKGNSIIKVVILQDGFSSELFTLCLFKTKCNSKIH